MSALITLDHFGASVRRFHLYRLCSSPAAEQMHHHDYFQVCFVSRGEILHEHPGKASRSVTLCHGDAFLIPPYFSHRIRFCGTESEIYSLSFREDLFHPGFGHSNLAAFLDQLKSHPDEAEIRLKLRLDGDQRANVQALFECLLREQNAGTLPELSAAASLIAAALCTLAQGYYQQPRNHRDYRELAACHSSMNRCIDYIDRHYRENITLQDLTRQFAMSRSAFSALFPQVTGMSLKQYICRKRIQEAEMLLCTRPELPLQEVAAMVGYEDPSTFYRNFVRVSGVSPSEYKKRLSAED